MFTLRDRRTGELFDRWSDFGDKRRRLMEQSWAGVFRNHLLVELPVDDLCRHLDERMGRPSKDPCLSGYHPHPLYVVCTHFPE